MGDEKIADKTLERVAEDAIQGSRAAFEEIYEAKRRELYLTALKLLGSREDAEDAVQDTLMAVFQQIHRLRHPSALNAWMYKILHQRCINIIRKRQRKRKLDTTLTDDDVADIVPDEDGDYLPEKHMEDSEMNKELYEAINALPEKSREALISYYFYDMKYREIAEATDTSVQTVSTNLIRARDKVRSQLVAVGAALKGAFAAKVSIAAGGMAAKVGVGVAAAVCAAGVTYYAAIGEATPLPKPEPEHFHIALAGADCECGHINPRSVSIEGLREGDVVTGWEVRAQNGEVVKSGSLAQVTAYIVRLEAAQREGTYRLHCKVTDKYGYEYGVSREIAIGGHYAGDL
jgi:RNA polymerase sigma-70 factor (ECF subfamily)